jgi:hypothetical protein
MAVFQLGAGITGLVGSSGGTTFKRNKSANVWMNKSRGASRSRLLQNTRLSRNSQIFKSWNFLGESEQGAWNANAAATKVKDKFGQDVNISGVSFQRRCQLAIAPVSSATIDPTNFVTDLEGLFIDTADMNWGGNFNVSIDNSGANSSFYVLMCEFTLKTLPAPQFIRRGVFFGASVPSGSETYDVYTYLINKYPFLNGNYNIRLYGYEINPTGWVGVMTAKDVTVV